MQNTLEKFIQWDDLGLSRKCQPQMEKSQRTVAALGHTYADIQSQVQWDAGGGGGGGVICRKY